MSRRFISIVKIKAHEYCMFVTANGKEMTVDLGSHNKVLLGVYEKSVISSAAVVVYAEETHTSVTGDSKFAYVDVVLNGKALEPVVNKISDLAGDYYFSNNHKKSNGIGSSCWLFRLAAYSFWQSSL